MEKVNYKFLHQDLEQIPNSDLKSFKNIYRIGKSRNVKLWAYGIAAILIVTLFLPWTQNIRAKGSITALEQSQRPQEINTIIPGKILKWYVTEGDYVNAGDTILQLGEIKVEYFDPRLLQRTREQIIAKQNSASGYESKANTAESQTNILEQGKGLKLSSIDNKIEQQMLKVNSDEVDLQAIKNELTVLQRQLDAGRAMLDSGAMSLIDYERRKVNYQNGLAKKNSGENKLSQSKQELMNLRIEQNIVQMDYNDKISKAEGDKFSSLSNAASTQADISKLENTYSSYDERNKLYYVIAPQAGQITKAKKTGIGEILKEGEMITEIVPNKIQYAVEMFIDPTDLPLISIGQNVRFIFDGIPAIVFSGWPNSSYGTFAGKISAIESNVSSNGKFRALVVEDNSSKKWPTALKMGNGAQGIALLKDVPIYYELWRNINGFPPEYYQQTKQEIKK